MKVAETFMSYQGEGPLNGRRTFFVRLAGCNLKCFWCDTKAAQDENAGKEMTADELYQILKSYHIIDVDICITGGEPLLQQTDKELLAFLDKCCLDHNITIETNGTILPTEELCHYVDVCIVSPKLEALGIHSEQFNYNYDTLLTLSYMTSFLNDGRVYYKFVVDPHDDEVFDACVEEIEHFAIENDVWYSNIYLMPKGQTKEEVQIGTEKLIERMTKQNLPYSITTRQHILFNFK